MSRHKTTASATLTALVIGALCVLPARAAPPLTFTVNSVADLIDASPGDGLCEIFLGSGVCTLRGAIQEANAHPGADTIILQSSTTYVLTRAGKDDDAFIGDLDITETVTIAGAGATSTIIDGNGGAIGDRVFHIRLSGAASISGVTIRNGNSAPDNGGGIYNLGTLTLTNSTVTGNTTGAGSARGGGIFNSGTLTLGNSTVTGNTTSAASSSGGGGILSYGRLTATNSTIRGNTTGGRGGGLLVFAGTDPSRLTNVTVSLNIAADGGGIYHFSDNLSVLSPPLILVNSTVSTNYATVDGGGLYNREAFTQLFNTTVTANQANADYSGSGNGGGVFNALGLFTFINSIIASNSHAVPPVLSPPDDCAGTITSHGTSILSAINSTYCTVQGPVTVSFPHLGPLDDNGSPTQTHALLAGSPARDAGNAGGCKDHLGAILTTDQRGAHRPAPYGGRCDIGAFEASGFTDDPLIAGTSVVRAVHIVQLRSRIDTQRTRFGLSPFGWTTPSLMAGMTVTAMHVSELRTALQQAYTMAGQPPPAFIDSPLVSHATFIRMIHIKQLRDAVLVLEAS